MVATAQGPHIAQTTERAESPFESGFALVAQRPALHLVPEAPLPAVRRAQRVRPAADTRALAMWPRLDRRILYRCHGDTGCLARAIARHRTTLSVENVIRILTGAEE